jgi:probable HAF family extracellular repeat protein
MTSHVHSVGYGLALFVLLLSIATVSAQSPTKASCNFKLFQLPQDIAASSPNGINDYGTVVGLAVDSGGGERGFTRSPAGAMNYYSAPNAEPTYRSFTLFTDLNNAGVKIGNYAVNSTGEVQKGFMLSGAALTSIAHPKSMDGTFVNGINKWNSVVGYYLDPLHAKGFKRFSSGSFVALNFPGAGDTWPTGINDSGMVVGHYPGHGFVYFKGQWATLDYPKASSTVVNGISNAGMIIGRSNTTKQGTAFLYQNGLFKVISVPNSFSTSANGISADGLITGKTNLDGTLAGWRGFIAICK